MSGIDAQDNFASALFVAETVEEATTEEVGILTKPIRCRFEAQLLRIRARTAAKEAKAAPFARRVRGSGSRTSHALPAGESGYQKTP